MDPIVITAGVLTLLTLLTRVPSLGERKRALQDKFEHLRARIDDIENIVRPSYSTLPRQSKKRKGDNEICTWVAKGRELLIVAENLLTRIQRNRSYLPSAKNRMVIENMVTKLLVHDKKGDMLYKRAFCNDRDPHHGNHIPVKRLMGERAMDSLEKLQGKLLDANVGRIAIRGIEGIGKTLLMKHLHNRALALFAYVFWVTTSPDQFRLELVQDAVAAVVKCGFAAGDDSLVRARKLSNKLRDIGNFVLFLDGVPNDATLSLDQIGIPVPAEGSECKLVLTSTSYTTNSQDSRMFHGFEMIEVNHLSENEAFELLTHEATGENRGNASFRSGIPRLIAMKCRGVPRTIVDVASCLRGIDDLHEWRNLMFEFGNL